MDVQGKCGNEAGTFCRVPQEWPGHGNQAEAPISCYCLSYLKPYQKETHLTYIALVDFILGQDVIHEL